MSNKLSPLFRANLSPFFRMNDFDKEFEEMFSRMRGLDSHFSKPAFPSNYREVQDAYLYSFDMPGVKEEDIKIEKNDGVISISAERKDQFEDGAESYFRYQQSFSIPKNVELDKIEAHYENGVLNIGLPKVEKALESPKNIEITSPQKKSSWWNPFN